MKRTKLPILFVLAAGVLLGQAVAAGGFAPGLLAQPLPGAAAAPGAQENVVFEVLLPADAILDIEGKRMTATGPLRRFETPPLAVGRRYRYTLKATSQGQEVTQEVHLIPGAENRFDLRPQFQSTSKPEAAPTPGGSPSPGPATGGGPARTGQAAQDKQVFSTKAVKRRRASAVPFRKQLGLPYQSLTTLGARIDAARRAHDGVTLAHCAQELHVAEKISGKKASITSSQLLQEAAQLAALKRQVAQMQAVTEIANEMDTEAAQLATYKENLALAQEQERADKAKFEMNEEPTWQPRKLVVNNYTTDTIDVYINGFMKGTVPPGMQITCTIDHRWNPVVVTGYGDQDVDNDDTYGPHYIWGRFDKYTWNIN